MQYNVAKVPKRHATMNTSKILLAKHPFFLIPFVFLLQSKKILGITVPLLKTFGRKAVCDVNLG